MFIKHFMKRKMFEKIIQWISWISSQLISLGDGFQGMRSQLLILLSHTVAHGRLWAFKLNINIFK